MGAVEIKPGIYWVGAVDWAVWDFHGYVIPNGTTYNNYLILDTHKETEKKTRREAVANVILSALQRLKGGK